MIPSSTIDFDVIEARQNGQSAISTVAAGSFVIYFLFPPNIEPGGGGVVALEAAQDTTAR
jgi:hypothetical protein